MGHPSGVGTIFRELGRPRAAAGVGVVFAKKGKRKSMGAVITNNKTYIYTKQSRNNKTDRIAVAVKLPPALIEDEAAGFSPTEDEAAGLYLCWSVTRCVSLGVYH
jgi:hypothetical protein